MSRKEIQTNPKREKGGVFTLYKLKFAIIVFFLTYILDYIYYPYLLFYLTYITET